MMKLSMWALIAVVAAVATPAFASVEGGENSTAVWIALGAVFMGVFTTLIAVLVAVNAKKKKSSSGE